MNKVEQAMGMIISTPPEVKKYPVPKYYIHQVHKSKKLILKYYTIPKYGEDSSWEELSDAKKISGCRC